MNLKDRSVLNNCIVDSDHLDIICKPPVENPVIRFQIDQYSKRIVGYELVGKQCSK